MVSLLCLHQFTSTVADLPRELLVLCRCVDTYTLLIMKSVLIDGTILL